MRLAGWTAPAAIAGLLAVLIPALGSRAIPGEPAPVAAPQNPSGPPAAPVLFAPANGAGISSTSPTLDVAVSDPAGSQLSVTFYGRVAGTVGAPFTLVALPDTQFYSSAENGGTPAMFSAQTQWIANMQPALNVAYVAHLGDIVQSGDNGGNGTEWANADAALKILEAAGIPFGVPPGNHDEGANLSDNGNAAVTDAYNTWFGVSRFSGRPYYGGHYSTTNDNHYDLFSAGGMDFIAIYFAYDTATTGARFQGVLAWANAVLKQYSNRHAILVSHYIINSGNPGTFGAQGQALFNALSGNANVFLMLSGHVNPNGEGQRADTVNGNAIQSVLSDFQNLANGGSGWLREMTFSPASNQISVQTYSPVLNQYMTDANSQFSLPWNMANSGYVNLGTVANVASGAHATWTWNNLSAGTTYEWYAVVTNGTYTTSGPTWNFTAGAAGTPQVSLSAGSLAFGAQTLNSSSATQNVQLTNPGNATLHLTSIGASGDYSQTNNCGASVGAGAACTISVTFTPRIIGADNGTITIADDAAGSPQTIQLTGTGTGSAPAITSAGSATFTVGTAGTFTVMATGTPAPTLSETGALPSGVTFAAATGKLAGTPAAGSAGSYALTITAHNGAGADAVQNFSLTVNQPLGAGVAFVRAAGNKGSAKYTVALAPAAGDFLAVFVWQSEGATTPSAVTDNRGDAYTRDCDLTFNQGAGARRVTVYHLLNAPSGITGVSITPNRRSQGIVGEYSGMPATGTVLDVCGAVRNQTSASKSWSSGTATTTATDLVFGLADTRSVANAGYASSGGWIGRLAEHDSLVADDNFVADRIGVAAGSYTATGTTTVSVTESAVVVAFRTGH